MNEEVERMFNAQRSTFNVQLKGKRDVWREMKK